MNMDMSMNGDELREEMVELVKDIFTNEDLRSQAKAEVGFYTPVLDWLNSVVVHDMDVPEEIRDKVEYLTASCELALIVLCLEDDISEEAQEVLNNHLKYLMDRMETISKKYGLESESEEEDNDESDDILPDEET